VRETVEREPDGCSVSYGRHLSSNLLKACVCFASVKTARMSSRGKVGCTMLIGASECVRLSGIKLCLGNLHSGG
jgi:hypothetical protein